MKILQLNMEAGWRGGERQTLLCLQEFRRAGHQAELVARRGGTLAARARAEGFTVHECKGPLGLFLFLLLRGRGFDILHAQTANTLTWLVLAKAWLRKPVAFTRRTAFALSQRKRKKTLLKWRRTDLFFAISQAAAQEPRATGLAVQIVPSAIRKQAVDTEQAVSVAARLGLGGRKVVATAAALTREKDPETLIRAIARLARERDDFVFLHLGAGGDAEAGARALVKSLGLQSQYIFAGFYDNVTDLYSLMDVFVLSSSAEALGTSVLDAFLCGVPVVTTTAGGLAELANEGRAWACAVGDDACLAAGIGRLLDDSVLASEQVERAQAYVLEQHDVEKMGARYLAAYAAALQSRF